MKITVSVSTRMNGSKVIETFEMPDDATEEEIEDAASLAAWDLIDYSFKVEK